MDGKKLSGRVRVQRSPQVFSWFHEQFTDAISAFCGYYSNVPFRKQCKKGAGIFKFRVGTWTFVCVVSVDMGSVQQFLLPLAVVSMHNGVRANSWFVSVWGRDKLAKNPRLATAFFLSWAALKSSAHLKTSQHYDSDLKSIKVCYVFYPRLEKKTL